MISDCQGAMWTSVLEIMLPVACLSQATVEGEFMWIWWKEDGKRKTQIRKKKKKKKTEPKSLKRENSEKRRRRGPGSLEPIRLGLETSHKGYSRVRFVAFIFIWIL